MPYTIDIQEYHTLKVNIMITVKEYLKNRDSINDRKIKVELGVIFFTSLIASAILFTLFVLSILYAVESGWLN